MTFRLTLFIGIALVAAACSGDGSNVLYRVPADAVDGTADLQIDAHSGGDAALDALTDETFLDVPLDDVVASDLLDLKDGHTDDVDLFDGWLEDGPAQETSDWTEDLAVDVVELVDLAEDIIDPATLIVPCETNEDCNLTGICLDNGTGNTLCYPWCEDEGDCPPLYHCAPPTGLEDSACLPLQAATQCKPCAELSDCSTPDFDVTVSCASLGDGGHFCARECTEDDSLPCPFGFQCAPVDDDGQEVLRCIPKEGKKCFCSEFMEGLTTQCTFSNYWGVCEGTRSCTEGSLTGCDAEIPVPEECNGKDDDCDGLIDEGLGAVGLTCLIDYDLGTCEFDMFCADGQWTCPDVAFFDICDADQNSCFWFGSVDDTDDDYDPDFCDDDDDNDGFLDVDDCQATDPNSYPGAEEICDGIDNDCNGVSDYNQLGLSSCNSDGAWGTCIGKGFCIDGEWQCQPPPPSPDTCPGPEDNCTWLPVPEGFDLDGDTIPDFCDLDDDGDDVADDEDNCLELFNPNQFDLDGDGEGDACDPDDDGDGSFDQLDCCPYLYNPNQLDTDEDGTCDACDSDDDNDGILDDKDNCQFVANPDQADNEQDDKGDACDIDDDNDGVHDTSDNCPTIANLFQDDNDLDGTGDVCDDDDDNDTIPDDSDNCPLTANENQSDLDEDDTGDLCDDDVDGDGALNDVDNCLVIPNPDQANLDEDDFGDACDPDIDGDGDTNALDNCTLLPNPEQGDLDGDCPPTPFDGPVACGDACDSDVDGDGVDNDVDNCPDVSNPDQADLDKDGTGDACTSDIDGDGTDDADDNCPKTYNPDQLNTDKDDKGDACDADDDNDLVFDIDDNCPTVPNPGQEDLNENGIGDACEPG